MLSSFLRTAYVQIDLASGKVLDFLKGDITRQSTDAIVNAANSSLLGGGGVDGAIHSAGGPQILEECRRWVGQHGALPTGEVMHTAAGRMNVRYVLHTVGPVWHQGTRGEPQLLASCYSKSIRLADQLNLRSVAFPSISTGVYGYPIAQAAPLAVATAASELLQATHFLLVRFVLFSESDFLTYTSAARDWLKAHEPPHK